MNNINRKSQIEDVPRDCSRLSPTLRIKDFFQSLKTLQIPCPWGDLAKGEGIENEFPYLPELARIPYIPIGLVIGAGNPIMAAYRSIASVDRFGKIIYTDLYDPRMGPEDYVQLDLNEPETINLFRFKVHALMSIGVFTYDGLGVNFRGQGKELEAIQKLTDMLMPGGIIANDNINGTRRFESILKEQFGFQLVRDTHSIILQKPF